MMDDNIARIFSIASRLAWIFHYKDYQTEHGWHGRAELSSYSPAGENPA